MKKPNPHYYRLGRFCAGIASRVVFRRKFVRNELKGKKGPAVLIANHSAMLDFLNAFGVTKTPMNFVVSNSFYSTLPKAVRKMIDKVEAIPKQQFQTSISDMHKMKGVIDTGGILVIYPAGLMCEDGRSTPIPAATYRFLQWLGVDVYVLRSYGSYFCMPKWAKKRRPGRTLLDVYKLIDKETLLKTPPNEFKALAEEAIAFDAYRDQEKLLIKYKKNHIVEGLENVLYKCPNCKSEFTISAKNDIISCSACGYTERCDKHGFLHIRGDVGEEIRYVSSWSEMIYRELHESIKGDELTSLSASVSVHKLNHEKHAFLPLAEATVTVGLEELTLIGDELEIRLPSASFPSLPFKPGVYLEIQDGDDIYRCYPNDGRLTMKLINMQKCAYAIKMEGKA